MLTQREREERERQRERRHELSRALARFPMPEPRSRREAPWWRTSNAIRSLGFVLETLADSRARPADVNAAIAVANAVYRAANLGGETFGRFAAMELVRAIRDMAEAVLDEGATIEEIGPPLDWARGVSDFVLAVDVAAFRTAVAAWVSCERAKRSRRRREGRTPDKWGPTLECLERFGLANGISSAASLRRIWREARPGAIPLSEFDD